MTQKVFMLLLHPEDSNGPSGKYVIGTRKILSMVKM